MTLLARYRRWQIARHTRWMNEQYAPRLTALRAFVGEKAVSPKVVSINLLVKRAERRKQVA